MFVDLPILQSLFRFHHILDYRNEITLAFLDTLIFLGPCEVQRLRISTRFSCCPKDEHVKHWSNALSARTEGHARRHSIAVQASGNVPARPMANLFPVGQGGGGRRSRRK